MYALKRLPLFAAGSSTFIIRTITTLGVSLPLTISPNSSLTRDTLFSPWSAVQSRGAKIKSMDLEAGDIFERKGRIYQVLKAKSQGRGGSATTQVDLLEVGTGNKTEQKFCSDEAFESVFVESKSLTFLYTEGDSVILMEPSTYEQTEVSKDFFGKNIAYLKDEMEVTLHFYDGNPMSASVPPLVTCTVIKETSPMHSPQISRVEDLDLDTQENKNKKKKKKKKETSDKEGRTAIPKYLKILKLVLKFSSILQMIHIGPRSSPSRCAVPLLEYITGVSEGMTKTVQFLLTAHPGDPSSV